MIENTINAKSEALELHELSSEELDVVSGGDKLSEQARQDQLDNQITALEIKKQGEALKVFQQILQDLP